MSKLCVDHECRIVAVSGGFDPVHMGHINYLKAARALGDFLFVIVNTNKFLLNKKGYYVFDLEERCSILESFSFVDYAFRSQDTDTTVCRTLSIIKPDIFAKGGDRGPGNVPEEKICNELGIQIVYGVGGDDKLNSSSRAIERAFIQLRSNFNA